MVLVALTLPFYQIGAHLYYFHAITISTAMEDFTTVKKRTGYDQLPYRFLLW